MTTQPTKQIMFPVKSSFLVVFILVEIIAMMSGFTLYAQITPTFSMVPSSICQDATAPVLPTTSDEGITGTWSPAAISTTTPGTSVYTFTPTTGQSADPVSLSITIVANITPTFATIPTSICQGATAPTLPATSDEGISGTWSPAVISTTAPGISLYTFTPTAGQCAVPFSLSITIVANITPTFAAIPTSICQNAIAPTLPATSDEGVSGTWSPAVISTTAPGTSLYTFTPTAGQCALRVSVNITIVNSLVPTFPTVPTSICQNATAPALPATSNEGVAGTWSPATINTAMTGNSVYTFTPSASSCAVPVSVNITIMNNVVPTFPTIPTSICQNATAPALPATSNEGVAGIWSPSTINTTTVGNAVYTFTPSASSCAVPVSVNITIMNNVVPTFPTIPTSICQNATAPALPATSNEGVAGIWSPTAINTTTVGNSVYTFTPSASCSSPVSVSITITSGIVPTFPNVPNSVCQNSTAPSLPGTSNEGVSGTWSPSSINTNNLGKSAYTFTPSAGSCSSPISVNITVVSSLVPTFPATPDSICQNAPAPVLPATSIEGVDGNWIPPSINTSVLGTIVYEFIPTSNNCASRVFRAIRIVNILDPNFPTLPDSICQFTTAPDLPTTSIEGVSGTWTPSSINTSVAGPASYTFTPAANQCGTTSQVTVVINPIPVLTMGPDITIPANGSTNLNVSVAGNIITYLWSPATGLSDPTIKDPVASPSATTVYRLDVIDDNQCASNGKIKITVLSAPSKISVPNAFSPNGDGINDTWIISNLSAYPGATVDVFNRYGQLVFHSENNSKAWDGTYNGMPLPLATYYYVINPKNNERKIAGSVTIFK